ncbi:hypothetical protein A2V82_13665 [candidate division KSB1 bacterium RBG_16_48_16]|nr:MAG: hypothetical protein A2V82_13665 [candidate division KSB1 bacterium RBG_16_48_16]
MLHWFPKDPGHDGRGFLFWGQLKESISPGIIRTRIIELIMTTHVFSGGEAFFAEFIVRESISEENAPPRQL